MAKNNEPANLDSENAISNYLQQLEDEYGEAEEDNEPKPFSYFDILDKPRILPDPVKLTHDHLKEIEQKLGLITLCWPKIDEVRFEDRSVFPDSYLENSNKEKLLLLYTENFRRQIIYNYPNRKPLFLASHNECGVQKMVCTTLRPSRLPYPEIETWKECASFVGDHINYEPLDDPLRNPDHLYSPHTTMLRQKGHCFELATTLCSLLLGMSYNAFVVSGYASKDITLKIMQRVDSPYPAQEEIEVQEEQQVTEPKYKLKTIRDLRSKYLLMMAHKEELRIQEEKVKQKEMERQKRLEEEIPPPDEHKGERVHAWVLIMKGGREIEESFFVEPSTGMRVELNDSSAYLRIESVWDCTNYWVNVQDPNLTPGELDYDFQNVEKWEHLLVGEPIGWRQQRPREGIIEEERDRDVFDEKHLDMPKPWSLQINVPHEVLAQRYPNGCKKTFYKRTYVEEFAPYIQNDGLIANIIRYNDFDCTDIKCKEMQFENRVDKLNKYVVDISAGLVTEYFDHGREDCVKKQSYYEEDNTINGVRTIEYYNEARFDNLDKIEITKNMASIKLFFKNPEDKLSSLFIKYDDSVENEPVEDTTRRTVLKIVQKFERDPETPASEDIAAREFWIKEGRIEIKYHYGEGKVTASTRTFWKQPMEEAGEIKFDPNRIAGYNCELNAKPPSNLKLFLQFREHLKQEEQLLHVTVRDIEKQIQEFLALREAETLFPKLNVSIFNREQNVDNKIEMLAKEKEMVKKKEKEIELEIDFLGAYLVNYSNVTSLSASQAYEIFNKCVTEFKDMIVRRANTCLKAHESIYDQMQELKEWYVSHRDVLTSHDENEYFEKLNDLNMMCNTLELRMQRAKDLSKEKYISLHNYLAAHPKLAILKIPKIEIQQEPNEDNH